MSYPTLLKQLVEIKHLRPYREFIREYDRTADYLDPTLVGSGPSKEQYERWLKGALKHRPRAHHCRVLEHMFPGHTVDELFAPPPPPASVGHKPAAEREEPATNRREVMALGAGTAISLLVSEPDEMHAALDGGSVSEERLTYLEGVADRLDFQACRSRGPSVLGACVTQFRSVRTLLTRPQRIANRVRLTRVGSRLASVAAEILLTDGNLPLANQWYAVSLHAALDIGDQALADVVLANSTFVPHYSGDPHGVIALTMPRLDSQNVGPSQGVAFLWAATARAHATLGERVAFRHAIERSRAVLDMAPVEEGQVTGLFTFKPEKLAFYEAYGCAHLNDLEGTLQSANRALELYDPQFNNDPALARFEKATVLVRSGEVNEGCRVASEAVLDPNTYLGQLVWQRADEFDRFLPQGIPPVREWQELRANLKRPRPVAIEEGAITPE